VIQKELIEISNKLRAITNLNFNERVIVNQCIERLNNIALNNTERFKKPTDKQIIEMAVLFNDGIFDNALISQLVAYGNLMIDRLYENGDIATSSYREA